MPDNKKHHYVPRFYLKRFSNEGKSISLWNIPSERIVPTANLKNQCYKDYFYGKELEVEDALSQTEDRIAELLRILDACLYPPPYRSPEYFLLMFYVLIQHGRTVYAVDAINEMTDKMMKHIFKHKAAEEGIDLDLVKIGLTDASRYVLGMTISNLPLLLDLQCKLLINETPVDFVTSDNPAVFYNQLLEPRTFCSNTGLASKGLQIFLPLDSRKQLLFYDPKVYRVGSIKSPAVVLTQPKDVYGLNALQFCTASENIYFEDQRFDVLSLHRKAAPFRNDEKTNMAVFGGEDTGEKRSEMIASSHEDIRINLKLSFAGITKSNKRWLADLMKSDSQPAVIVRDEKMVEFHKEIIEKIEEQELDIGTYFQVIEEAFCQE